MGVRKGLRCDKLSFECAQCPNCGLVEAFKSKLGVFGNAQHSF